MGKLNQHFAVACVTLLIGLSALRAGAEPVITEVCWMGASSANDEWIEIFNQGPGAIELDGYVLVEGTTERVLPAESMAVGDVVVIEKGANAITTMDNSIVPIGLNNGGEALRLCPVGQTTDLAACDVVNGGGAWFAGSNAAPKATMVRLEADVDGQSASNWVTYAGVPSSEEDSAGAAINGSPGVFVPAPAMDAGPQPEPEPTDAGMEPEPEPTDGGLPPVDAGPDDPSPRPFITEVCWMGSSSSSNDEYVELHNPNAMPVLHLSEFVLNEGGTVHPLPDVMIPAGGFLVLERSAPATTLQSPDAEVLAFSSGLRNDGETLSICRVSDLADCDVANMGAAWAAGDNDDKLTMVRVHYDLPGTLVTSWRDFSGPVSAVGDSLGVGFLGSPGEGTFGIPTGPDGGPTGDDGGPFILPDAGPNDAPTISLSEPAGSVSGSNINIVYSAEDPDQGDFVDVSLYYDLDGDGSDGVVIASGLPLGRDLSFTWDTTGVPAGTFNVFGRAEDYRGKSAVAYAAGTVTVGNNTDGATLIVTEPDGVNDTLVGGYATIRWEATLPTVTGGIVSLYFDTDASGADGVGIATGLPVSGDDAVYLWDVRDLDPGDYNIYATLDWAGGQETTYAAASINIPDENCGCVQAGKNGAGSTNTLPAASLVAILLASLYVRRQRRTTARSTARQTRG